MRRIKTGMFIALLAIATVSAVVCVENGCRRDLVAAPSTITAANGAILRVQAFWSATTKLLIVTITPTDARDLITFTDAKVQMSDRVLLSESRAGSAAKERGASFVFDTHGSRFDIEVAKGHVVLVVDLHIGNLGVPERRSTELLLR